MGAGAGGPAPAGTPRRHPDFAKADGAYAGPGAAPGAGGPGAGTPGAPAASPARFPPAWPQPFPRAQPPSPQPPWRPPPQQQPPPAWPHQPYQPQVSPSVHCLSSDLFDHCLHIHDSVCTAFSKIPNLDKSFRYPSKNSNNDLVRNSVSSDLF